MFEAKEESVGIAISVPGQSSFSSRTLYIDESVSTVDGIFLKTVSALTAVCGGGTGGGAGLRGGGVHSSLERVVDCANVVVCEERN